MYMQFVLRPASPMKLTLYTYMVDNVIKPKTIVNKTKSSVFSINQYKDVFLSLSYKKKQPVEGSYQGWIYQLTKYTMIQVCARSNRQRLVKLTKLILKVLSKLCIIQYSSYSSSDIENNESRGYHNVQQYHTVAGLERSIIILLPSQFFTETCQIDILLDSTTCRTVLASTSGAFYTPT